MHDEKETLRKLARERLSKGGMSMGDLISREELLERIEGIWDCNDMVFKPDDHICNIPTDCKGCKWKQTVDYIKRMVKSAPTIIPAETTSENEIKIIDTKGKPNYDPKHRFVIPAEEGKKL